MVKHYFYIDDDVILEKFKKCEVVDHLEDDYTTTLTWVKDGILSIIEKQQKEIKRLSKGLR